MPNQLITWPLLRAFQPVDVVRTICWSSSRASDGFLVTLIVPPHQRTTVNWGDSLSHQTWTIEDWKTSQWHSEGLVETFSCLVSLVRAGAGTMVWGIYWSSYFQLLQSFVADHAHPFRTSLYLSSDGYFSMSQCTYRLKLAFCNMKVSTSHKISTQ